MSQPHLYNLQPTQFFPAFPSIFYTLSQTSITQSIVSTGAMTTFFSGPLLAYLPCFNTSLNSIKILPLRRRFVAVLSHARNCRRR